MKKVIEYDGLSIQELEEKASKMFKLSRESQKELYEVLEYLRITGRYKENKRYSRATFWTYLEDMFMIREGTFRKYVNAYIKFPEYSDEYGAGIVVKINMLCGIGNVDNVINEIKKFQMKRKKPIQREDIENIISQYRTRPRIEKVITDWKCMYETEKIAHYQTIERLRSALNTIEELNGQIIKLKKSIISFNKGVTKPRSKPRYNYNPVN